MEDGRRKIEDGHKWWKLSLQIILLHRFYDNNVGTRCYMSFAVFLAYIDFAKLNGYLNHRVD